MPKLCICILKASGEVKDSLKETWSLGNTQGGSDCPCV